MVRFSADEYRKLMDDFWEEKTQPLILGIQERAQQAQQMAAGLQQTMQQHAAVSLPTLDDLTAGWKTPSADEQRASGASVLPSLEELTRDWGKPQLMPTSGTPAPDGQSQPPGSSSETGISGAALDMSSPDAYKASLMAHARAVAQRYDLPAEIMAAIPIQEAGYQGSDLSRRANNFFSIKGQGPAGSVDYDGVWEVINGQNVSVPASFRKYNSPAESFEDFAKFLHENPRYQPALDAYRRTRDAGAFAQALNDAGYATDPTWGRKVAQLAREMPGAAQGFQGEHAVGMDAARSMPAADLPTLEESGAPRSTFGQELRAAFDEGRGGPNPDRLSGYASDEDTGITVPGDEPLLPAVMAPATPPMSDPPARDDYRLTPQEVTPGEAPAPEQDQSLGGQIRGVFQELGQRLGGILEGIASPITGGTPRQSQAEYEAQQPPQGLSFGNEPSVVEQSRDQRHAPMAGVDEAWNATFDNPVGRTLLPGATREGQERFWDDWKRRDELFQRELTAGRPGVEPLSPDERAEYDRLGLQFGSMVGMTAPTRAASAAGAAPRAASPPWTSPYANQELPPPNLREGLGAAERTRRAFVRAWTDNLVDLTTAQEAAAREAGRDLTAQEAFATRMRENPSAAAETILKNGPLRDAIQTVHPEELDLLNQVLTYHDNIDVAASVADRVTRRALGSQAPIAGEAAVANAERALNSAEANLEKALTATRTPSGPVHTGYQAVVERQSAQVERLQQQLDRVHTQAAEAPMNRAGDALEAAQAEVDRLHGLRGTADEPDPAAYERMLRDAQASVDRATARFDTEQGRFADRFAEIQAESARRQLERAQAVADRVAGLEVTDRARVEGAATAAVERARARLAKAETLLKANQEERVRQAMAKGTAAGENRKFSGDLSAADSHDRLEWMAENLPADQWERIQKARESVRGFVDDYRQRMVDAGVWSQELADELGKRYPNYVPTRILDYLSDPQAVANGRSLSLRDRGLRSLTDEGTVRERETPLASLVRFAMESERTIHQNEVFRAFVKASEAAPDAIPLKPVTSSHTATNDARLVTGFLDGKRATFETTGPLAAALKVEASTPLPWISAATSLFREFITRSPVFVAGQVPLDAFSYAVRETAREHGNLPRVAIELARAYADAFKGIGSGRVEGDLRRFLEGGSGMAGLHDRSARAMATTVDDLAKQSMIEIRNAGDVGRLVKWLATAEWSQAVGQRVEMAPRLAAGRMAEQRALRQGADAETALMRGVSDFRDVTIDFQRGGTWAKTMNQITPFFNVGWQSAATVSRAMRENPRAFPLTVMGLVGLPAVAAEEWNLSDPQRAKDYADVPQYIKDRGIVIMLPGEAAVDSRGDRRPNYALIPLRELAPFAILSREAYDSGRGAPTQGLGAVVGASVAAASPIQANNPADFFNTTTPLGASTGLQLATNRDVFRGRTIATDRNDEEASALSKGLAAATGWGRPSQWEFGLRDLGGNLSATALAASDLVTGQQNKPTTGGIQDAPVVGGLVKRFVGNSVGQGLQDAMDERVSEGLRDVLSEAGLREEHLSPTRAEVQGMQLSRAEQTEYQRRVNSAMELATLDLVTSSKWLTSPSSRPELVRTKLAQVKAQVLKDMMPSIDPAGVRREQAKIMRAS